MADRRMIAIKVIDTDAFLEMSMRARLLYYDLAMRADDDGFVGSTTKIMKFVGATKKELNELIARGYLIDFEGTSVVAIRHWKKHNYIRKDRYTETEYVDLKRLVALNDKGEYEKAQTPVISTPATNGQPLGNQRATQVRLGKVRLGKDNCSSSYTRVWDELTDEEIEEINKYWYDGDGLISEVAKEVKLKHKIVNNVYAYVVGYANNSNWETQKQHEAITKILAEEMINADSKRDSN